jgi:plastocyanin
MTRIALLAATLIVAAVAAGCGGSSNDKSSSSQPAPATKAPAGTKTAATSAGGSVSIDMKNIKFDPAQQTVSVGQKVIWTNQDTVDHNVTANAGASFHSQDFGQGKTYEFTPTKAGTIKYVCTLHPGMDGTLTVTG